jgi:protocatechuate 3,4-dioxygenase beta subunit
LPAGAALAGRVVNEAGAPVAGAWLQVRPVPDAPPASTESAEASPWFLRQRTTNEGGFRISGLRSGRLDLTIQAPGRGGAQLDELRLDAPGTLDLGEIVLPDGHALAGRVVDTEGQPIGGANISVNSDDGPGAMVATDAEGQFRVPGLASGLYSLHASERGHAWTRVFDVPAGTEDLRIVMPRYGSLEVRVLDHETGTPIADATVEASLPLAERYHPWSAFQFRVESGDAGADGAAAEPGVHRVWGAGAQGTELTVSAKDYITARIDAPGVRDGEMREVDVILRRGLVLAGRVVDADGAPIGGARVIAEARTEAHTLAADDEGRFRFGMLSDGAWRLVAEASGYHAAAPLEVVMQADTPLATVTLGMFQASRIEGVVYGPSGSPRPGCRVVATPRVPAGFDARERRLLLWYAEPGDPYGLWHATTDAAGRYVLSDLPPGRYAAWVSRGEQDQEFAVLASLAPDEAWDAACRSADAAAGTTTTLDIVQPAPATLHGRVIAGNLPQAGAAVALIYADVEYTNKLPPHPVALVETDELGRFEIGDLVPHRYALVALVTDSPVPAVQLVQPRAGERLHRELHVGGADAVVTVTERPQGTPVAGARLNLRPMRFTDGHPGQELWEPQFAWFVRTLLRETDRLPFGARSDAEGRFRLRHLPPGEYHVRVEGNPYLPAELQLLTVPATGHPDVMAFDLVRGAVIEGTVTTAGLTRYSALDVRLFRADGWYVGTSSIVDGRFRFEGLDAGTFSVRIQDGPDLATTLAAQEVTLGAGQQREIALRVDG